MIGIIYCSSELPLRSQDLAVVYKVLTSAHENSHSLDRGGAWEIRPLQFYDQFNAVASCACELILCFSVVFSLVRR